MRASLAKNVVGVGSEWHCFPTGSGFWQHQGARLDAAGGAVEGEREGDEGQAVG